MLAQNDVVPTKWKKYLLLEEHGLQELANIRDGIRRYPRRERERFVRDLEFGLHRDEADLSRAFYVVKLVPLVQEGQLPNYRVYGRSDLVGLPRFFEEHDHEEHVEIWYCRTAISQNVLSTAGRIAFLADGQQVIEHVDGCSPRLIESFSSQFKWPFIRASRRGWGRRFTFDLIHVPKEQSGNALSAFRQTIALLEQQRESVESFCGCLEAYHFAAYSLEYKLVGSWFSIIDWDTPNDLKVLR